MRTHIVLDEELIEEIDKIAGKRKRSAFIEDAIRAKLQREILGRALQSTKGSLKAEDYPEWSTPEAVSEWVHNMREADNALMERRREEREALQK